MKNMNKMNFFEHFIINSKTANRFNFAVLQ